MLIYEENKRFPSLLFCYYDSSSSFLLSIFVSFWSGVNCGNKNSFVFTSYSIDYLYVICGAGNNVVKMKST